MSMEGRQERIEGQIEKRSSGSGTAEDSAKEEEVEAGGEGEAGTKVTGTLTCFGGKLTGRAQRNS